MNDYRERNIVMVAGPSGSGKTKALNVLRDQFSERGVPFEEIPLSDAQTILDHVQRDDKKGGQHHYHRNPQQVGDHHHETDLPITPFTLAGDEIVIGMQTDFFLALNSIPQNEKVHLAELSGGRNINPPEDPASRTDISFATIAHRLTIGEFEFEGLRQILAVVHPQASFEIRKNLNEGRGDPTAKEIAYGRASWKLNEAGMEIFGEDDFPALLSTLTEAGISLIMDVKNDGTKTFEAEVKDVGRQIIDLWQK